MLSIHLHAAERNLVPIILGRGVSGASTLELGTVLMNEIEYGILKHLNMFPCFVRKVKRVFAILVKSGKNFRVLGEK